MTASETDTATEHGDDKERPRPDDADNLSDRDAGDDAPDPDKETPSEEGVDGSADPGKAFRENPPSDEEQAEIEEEREERLDPDNRPDGAEVDNTGENAPDFLKEEHSGEGVDGSSDPSQAFRENPPSDEEQAEIEKEREDRLDPDNRPDGAEVDNTSSSPGTTDDEPGTSD